MRYCSAKASQYTFRHDVYSVTTPERTRAIRMPSMSPETTIERAVARRCAGARSPTSGSTGIRQREKVVYCGLRTQLRGHGCQSCQEGEKAEDGKGVRNAETDPESRMIRTMLAYKNFAGR